MKKVVGLQYESGTPAPFVTVKAAGAAAERLVEFAHACGVPVESRPELTEVLFPVDIDTMIPEHVFKTVARLLVFVGAVTAQDSTK